MDFSSTAFKDTIDNYETFQEFCNGNLDAQGTTLLLHKQSHWLIYLIIKERLNDIQNFLREFSNEYRVQLLNLPTEHGNILHEVYYWCSNNNGVDLFRILFRAGAEIIRNNSNQLPNELTNTLWIYNGYIVRRRSVNEFNFINREIVYDLLF